MLSVDFLPTPTDEATKEVDKVLLGIQTEKANYNRKQVQNQNYGATNYDLEQREAEILEVKNDMRNRDQRLYSTLITMVITADTKQELDNVTDTVFQWYQTAVRHSLLYFVISSLTDLILFCHSVLDALTVLEL